MRHARLSKKCRAQWPIALFLMANALKSGLTLERAFHLFLAESPDPLRGVLKRRWASAYGEPWRRAITTVFVEPELILLRATLIMAQKSGGELAGLVETSARLLQQQLDLEAKQNALAAQNKASAWIIGVSPFVLVLLLKITADDYVEPLFTTAMGHGILALSFFLSTVGLIVVTRTAQSND